ncbi:MAG: phosphoglycerate kinase, partial [Candidatus Planktophila sp.]
MNSLASLDVAGKRVFLRCDLNVPLKNGEITDDGRIRASLPTILNLLERGASIVIGAHLGRPKGEVKAELSLQPVASRLAQLLEQPVDFITQKSAKILLLENLRFNSAETSKEDSER